MDGGQLSRCSLRCCSAPPWPVAGGQSPSSLPATPAMPGARVHDGAHEDGPTARQAPSHASACPLRSAARVRVVGVPAVRCGVGAGSSIQRCAAVDMGVCGRLWVSVGVDWDGRPACASCCFPMRLPDESPRATLPTPAAAVCLPSAKTSRITRQRCRSWRRRAGVWPAARPVAARHRPPKLGGECLAFCKTAGAIANRLLSYRTALRCARPRHPVPAAGLPEDCSRCRQHSAGADRSPVAQ